MVLRLNLYAVVFIMLAVLSNVVLLCVFDQGVLAYTSAVIFPRLLLHLHEASA
jgi:hypothetical protein